MIINDMHPSEEGMKAGGALISGDKKGFTTPIRILYFDSAGKSGSSMIGTEADVEKTGADL